MIVNPNNPRERSTSGSRKKKTLNPFTIQSLILHELDMRGPGGANDINRRLAKFNLNCTIPAIRAAATRLENKGYIERLPDESLAGIFPRIHEGVRPIYYQITQKGINVTWGQRKATKAFLSR